MIDELERMMIESEAYCEGLDDRSEELSERSAEDAQIRFYRAMAQTGIQYEKLLPELARAVADVMFDACLVYRVVDDGPAIELAGVYHPNAHALSTLERTYDAHELRVGEGIVGGVIATQQPYFRERWSRAEIEREAQAPFVSMVLALKVHGLIVVPLVTSEGQVLGAIAVMRHTTTASFLARDLALAQWIASHAAMQLDTARLYQNLRATNARLDQALKARDVFISMAAHELRTPLTAMKLQVHMLMHQSDDAHDSQSGKPNPLAGGLGSINTQIDRLNRLVSQLLDVSVMDSGGLAPELALTDLGLVVREVARRFALELNRANCALRLHLETTQIGHWDRDRIDQVVTNLLSNAIKYGAGKPIEIEVSAAGAMARLTVRDHGMGIDEANRERIFERFERLVSRRQVSGLGLGLWIVRRIVEMHDGTITLTSAPGEGSSFAVELPRSGPTQERNDEH
ncbi:MAG: GAF domain-containing sensor histidine kinase [Bradymonadaceae bacterium]|nr:GAF domain-containing sensor histidine kinase [Lujinxingiaceae bacterium]